MSKCAGCQTLSICEYKNARMTEHKFTHHITHLIAVEAGALHLLYCYIYPILFEGLDARRTGGEMFTLAILYECADSICSLARQGTLESDKRVQSIIVSFTTKEHQDRACIVMNMFTRRGDGNINLININNINLLFN
jgi:hypothetical protein